MGTACIDIEKMIEFYTSVFRMQVSDKGPGRTFPYMLAFLSGTPDQHHQLVLAQNRSVGSQSTVMEISFMAQTLDDLRVAKARALQHGAKETRADPSFQPVMEWSAKFKVIP
jgi:catechol 2,3-dioxygenase